MSVRVKQYKAPCCDLRKIGYYVSAASIEGVSGLIEELLSEVQERLSYKVCYDILPVTVNGDLCDFGSFSVTAADLASNLRGCSQVVLFAATVGAAVDRMIARYNRISPAKALLLQAIGTERVEALCDLFCKELAEMLGVRCRPRFSPGYGAVPLSVQHHFFEILDCPRKIGVCLADSLLMTPTKSVTAFVGVQDERDEG